MTEKLEDISEKEKDGYIKGVRIATFVNVEPKKVELIVSEASRAVSKKPEEHYYYHLHSNGDRIIINGVGNLNKARYNLKKALDRNNCNSCYFCR
jgi:hypothetical protein